MSDKTQEIKPPKKQSAEDKVKILQKKLVKAESKYNNLIKTFEPYVEAFNKMKLGCDETKLEYQKLQAKFEKEQDKKQKYDSPDRLDLRKNNYKRKSEENAFIEVDSTQSPNPHETNNDSFRLDTNAESTNLKICKNLLEKDMILVRDALKPHRGEVFEGNKNGD